MKVLSSEARKAQMAFVVGFLGPILTYLQAEVDWSWRAFFGAVVSGVISGALVYNVPNTPVVAKRKLKLRDRRRRDTQEDS